jgi:hypothetical protein
MTKWILHVESRPTSAEAAADYHAWYDKTHIPEIVEVGGFVTARRFEPVDGDGPFLAIYEIDADDVEDTRAKIAEATKSGRTAKPVGVEMDPPPTVRYFREITAYAAP